MKAIKIAAEKFLRGDVEEWTNLAETFRREMIDFAETYASNAYFVGLSGTPTHEIFDNAIWSSFYDPEFVRKIASAPTTRELRRIIRATVMDTAEEISEEIGTGEQVFYNRDPLLDWSRDIDPEEPVAWIPRREFVYALDEALEASASPAPQTRLVHPSDLVVSELDLVDLALYQTLAAHPELARTMSWRVFEKLLADILEEFGFEVELAQGTKDGGIDVVAVKAESHFGVHRYLLQAKRWMNKVGIEPVQRLLFLHSEHRATKSCLVTTSTFTSGAWRLAHQHQWQLELRDFDGLNAWIQSALEAKRQREAKNRFSGSRIGTRTQ